MQREEALRLAMLCRDRAPASENDWITISIDALAEFATLVEQATRDQCARQSENGRR